MKVKVINQFRDINSFSKVYNVGDIIEVSDERGENLIKLNLVEKEKAEEPLQKLKMKNEKLKIASTQD